ncbi:hypothetical protein GCM10023321_82550 [Pseudonocardia eucalypti]|uniref:ABC transporter ATP-binding protein n=1 Tax=Pseudonocardia eucalypti TaxID=648755 RepID=A0ABP9REF3_9PSEU|nr:ABC-type multidrug transport system fused ATPase/permease subunit [Pseudonocardia eucalypti]
MRAGELAADLAAPWPLALVIDHVLLKKPLPGFFAPVATIFGEAPVAKFAVAAVAVLLITATSGMFDYLGDRMMNSSGERITSSIRSDVFAHLQRLPMTYHDEQPVGELTSRVATDTGRIENGLVELFSTFIPGVLSLVGFAVVMLTIDWRLGLIALAAAPLVFATASRYTRLTRKAARQRRAAEGRMSGFIAESLQGMRTIHAFGSQDAHDRRFADGNADVLRTGLRSVELRARFTPLLEAVSSIGTASLLFVGGYGAMNNWWTIGVLMVVSSYLKDMLKPLRSLSKLALTFTQGAASAERIAAIFDEPRPSPGDGAGLPERIAGGLHLSNVRLDYGRGPVLNGLEFTVRPGERIALLGANGAGKSTVLSLIAGLYAPTEGDVLLDGTPLSEAPDWWRHRQVSMVLQDTFLFSGTIADNIRYGRPDATDEEVTDAAAAALVNEFTDRLEHGLFTKLSDGGVGLSGGQRQRVGIARALLLDAPVVLLDEPTTGLDVHAEELVVRALTRLAEGRTVLMTTHRPALIRLATRVVHLEKGRLRVEQPRMDPRQRPMPPRVQQPRFGPQPPMINPNEPTRRLPVIQDGFRGPGARVPRIGTFDRQMPPLNPANGTGGLPMPKGRPGTGQFAATNGQPSNGQPENGYPRNGLPPNGNGNGNNGNGSNGSNGNGVSNGHPNGNGHAADGQSGNGHRLNGQHAEEERANGEYSGNGHHASNGNGHRLDEVDEPSDGGSYPRRHAREDEESTQLR